MMSIGSRQSPCVFIIKCRKGKRDRLSTRSDRYFDLANPEVCIYRSASGHGGSCIVAQFESSSDRWNRVCT